MRISASAAAGTVHVLPTSDRRRQAAVWLTLLGLVPVMASGAVTVWGILATRGRPLLIVSVLVLFIAGVAQLVAIANASKRPVRTRQAWLAAAGGLFLSGTLAGVTLFRIEQLLSRLAWGGLLIALLVTLVLALAARLEDQTGEQERLMRRILVIASAVTMLWYVVLILVGPQDGGFPVVGAPTLMAMWVLALYGLYGEPLVVRA